MAVEKCHVCGSKAIIPEVRVVDQDESAAGRNLSVEITRKPTAFIFKQPHRETLKAWICGECGHVELFIANPTELYESWVAHEEDLQK